MIRRRIGRIDDKALYGLIAKELLPFTLQSMPDLKIDMRMIRRHLDKNITYVLTHRRSVCGFVSFRREGDKLFIDMLAVDGSRQAQGLGHRLMAAAERFGSRKRCKIAQLYVDESNTKAMRFYLRLGYESETYFPSSRCHLLRKRLNPPSFIKA